MRRRLSSLQTFLTKIIFPVFCVFVGGIVILGMFLNEFAEHVAPPWPLLFGWLIGTGFIYRSCIRLKAVSIDENFLYVSNYLKEVSIPLSEIYDVTENRWLNIHPVTIHLRSPSDFGDKIIFMPRVRFSFLDSHPVVGELKKLARSTDLRRAR